MKHKLGRAHVICIIFLWLLLLLLPAGRWKMHVSGGLQKNHAATAEIGRWSSGEELCDAPVRKVYIAACASAGWWFGCCERTTFIFTTSGNLPRLWMVCRRGVQLIQKWCFLEFFWGNFLLIFFSTNSLGNSSTKFSRYSSGDFSRSSSVNPLRNSSSISFDYKFYIKLFWKWIQ